MFWNAGQDINHKAWNTFFSYRYLKYEVDYEFIGLFRSEYTK